MAVTAGRGGREVVASAARTASGNSGLIAPGGGSLALGVDRVSLLLNVTAASGTSPTLNVSIEWSMDGGGTYAASEPVDSFGQITAAEAVVKKFDAKSGHYRIVWAIAGTAPSFTFSIREAVG